MGFYLPLVNKLFNSISLILAKLGEIKSKSLNDIEKYVICLDNLKSRFKFKIHLVRFDIELKLTIHSHHTPQKYRHISCFSMYKKCIRIEIIIICCFEKISA